MERSKKFRPRGVTLLALGVLSLAIFNLLGLVQVLTAWNYLKQFSFYLPLLLGLTRLFWGLAGLWVGWSLWSGQAWSPVLTRWVSLTYVLYLWATRLFLFRTAEKGANNLFVLVSSLLVLGVIFWILASRQAKHFFGVNDGYLVEKQLKN
ncbi:MAG: hypothetical protein H6Q37_856 [Chloroflexi bacterium]|jgi:hypothetical protein|nr:hypothetical protein [Chloroflexota bacterium]